MGFNNYLQIVIIFLICVFTPEYALTTPKPVVVNPKSIFSIKKSNGKKIYCSTIKNVKTYGKIVSGKKNLFIPGNLFIKELKLKLSQAKRAKDKKAISSLTKKLKLLNQETSLNNNICKNGSDTPSPTPTSSTPTTPPTPFAGDPNAVSLEPIERNLTSDEVRTLFVKAGFGFTEKEQTLINDLGSSPASGTIVDRFMAEREEDNGVLDTVTNFLDGDLSKSSWQHTPSGQRQAIFYLMANTNNYFAERLTLALLGIWTVAGDVIADETFRHTFWNYYQILRKHAHGIADLPSLGIEVTRDPLMLIYLNNGENTKESPNENYARELQELFTMGPENLDGLPNYTETTLSGAGDIATAARALTGLTYNLNYSTNQIDVSYQVKKHAVGPHVMYPGTPYQFSAENYEDLINGIFSHHPNVKFFYAKELLKEYVTPNPPRELIEAFGKVIADSNYQLRTAMSSLLKSKAFYNPLWKDSLPKNSLLFGVEAVKILGLSKAYNYGEADRQMMNMQMPINLAPSVFWFNPEGWTNPAILMEKANFLSQILGDSTAQNSSSPPWDPMSLVPSGNKSPSEVIEYVRTKLGLPEFSADQKAALVNYMNTVRWYDASLHKEEYNNQNLDKVKQKGHGLYYLLLNSMQFQLE